GRVPPRPRQLAEPIAIRDDDEVPGLLVHRGGRSPPGFEDPVEVVVGDRSVFVRPNVPTSPKGVPGLHLGNDSSAGTGRLRTLGFEALSVGADLNGSLANLSGGALSP